MIKASKIVSIKQTLDDFTESIAEIYNQGSGTFSTTVEDCDERTRREFEEDLEKSRGGADVAPVTKNGRNLIRKIMTNCDSPCIGQLNATLVFGAYTDNLKDTKSGNLYIYGGKLWEGFAAWTYGKHRKFPIFPELMQKMLDTDKMVTDYLNKAASNVISSRLNPPRYIIPIKIK